MAELYEQFLSLFPNGQSNSPYYHSINIIDAKITMFSQIEVFLQIPKLQIIKK